MPRPLREAQVGSMALLTTIVMVIGSGAQEVASVQDRLMTATNFTSVFGGPCTICGTELCVPHLNFANDTSTGQYSYFELGLSLIHI